MNPRRYEVYARDPDTGMWHPWGNYIVPFTVTYKGWWLWKQPVYNYRPGEIELTRKAARRYANARRCQGWDAEIVEVSNPDRFGYTYSRVVWRNGAWL